jgi:DNA invertase Pin-like site-specific DNA recombinase
MAKQILLRRWQQVVTTGQTKRGNGYRVGETHHRAKLTDHDVELIRLLHEDGMSCTEIAVKFECTRQNISAIVNYKHRIGVGMGKNSVFE